MALSRKIDSRRMAQRRERRQARRTYRKRPRPHRRIVARNGFERAFSGIAGQMSELDRMERPFR